MGTIFQLYIVNIKVEILILRNRQTHHMQGKGLFNKTITALAERLYNQTAYKKPNQLIDKALSLGIPICPTFNRERTLFVITQSIITLVDQIVAKEKQEKKVPIKSESLIKSESPIEHDSELNPLLLQQKSSVNNSPKCLMGNLHIAALIYRFFCPDVSIWDIIERVTAIKRELQRQDGIFQIVKLQDRIYKIENLGKEPNLFVCHCKKIGSQKANNYVLECHHCLQEFHPVCQSNSVFCSRCFLRFGLMDLKGQMQDPFNYHKQIEVKFFSYLNIQFPKQSNPKLPQSIFFQVVKFQLQGFSQQVDKKLRYVEIRICVVNKVFPDELLLTLRPNCKIKREGNSFWEIDEVQYYFYLNHNEIKFTQSVSKNCILLKVPHRMLEKQSNILIIKTVRRNQKYNFKQSNVLTYWPQKQSQPKILMLGVFEISRKKVSAKSRDTPVLGQTSPDTLRPITLFQSYHYLQFIQKEINQVPYQIVNLYNQSGSKKIQTPVRSYGCNHVQCFDYVEFKQAQRAKKEKMPKKQKPAPIIDFKINIEKLIEIQQQNSSSVILIVEDGQGQAENPQQSTKSNNSKKITKPLSSRCSSQKQKKIKNEAQPDEELQCPICHRKLLILYEDPLFKQIILNSGFYKRVKIMNNGEYLFDNILKDKQKKDEIQIIL